MATTKEYRGRHEIIANMLSIINDSGIEGVSKTSVMYKSFLSYTQLTEYLSLLMENGLLEELPLQSRKHHNEKNVYRITQKGLRLLQVFSEINSLTGPEKIS